MAYRADVDACAAATGEVPDDLIARYRAESVALVRARVSQGAWLYGGAGAALAVIDGWYRYHDSVPLAVGRAANDVRLPWVAATFLVVLVAASCVMAWHSQRASWSIDRFVAWWIGLLALTLAYFVLTGADRSLVAFWIIGSGMTAAIMFPWGWVRQACVAAAGFIAYVPYVSMGMRPGYQTLPFIYPFTAVMITGAYSVIGADGLERMRFAVSCHRHVLARQLEEREALRRRRNLALIGEAAERACHILKSEYFGANAFAQALVNAGHPEPVRRDAGKIVESLTEAQRVVGNLMVLGTARKLKIQDAGVRQLLEECVDGCRSRAAAHGVALEMSDETGAGTWPMDAWRVKHAVRVLVDNAIEASHADGAVEVAARSVQEDLELEVRDYGTGLAEDIEGRLLTPLVTSKPTGMGLGLVLANEVIESHGGTLTWARQNPGTSFYIRLPRRVGSEQSAVDARSRGATTASVLPAGAAARPNG